MPKYILFKKGLSEWGVSPDVSVAVPSAASGAEIKSTEDVSNGMYLVLRSELEKDGNLLRELKKVVADAKQKAKNIHPGSTFFRLTRAKSGIPVARRNR